VVPGLVMSLLILVFLGTLRMGGKAAPSPKAATASREQGQGLAQYLQGLKGLMRNRSLVLLSTGGAFRSMTQNALLTFLPLFLAREMGYSPTWVGVAMFVLQAAGLAASPVAGHLSDKMGRRSVLMGTMAMTAVILVFMAVAGRSTAFVFFVALLGFFLYAIRPVIQAWTVEATPKHMGGSAIGILFGAQSLGSSVAPLIGGVLADAYGLGTVFYFLAFTIVCANVLIFFTPERERTAP
jgi:sugar phosphate permease